jgi:hypothetical protein
MSRAHTLRTAFLIVLFAFTPTLRATQFFEAAEIWISGFPFEPGHGEWTYNFNLGPNESINYGDFLEIVSGPAPADSFNGFQVDLSENAFPWCASSLEECSFNAPCPGLNIVCSDRVFCAPNAANLCAPTTVKYPARNWICSLTRDASPENGSELMPNGQSCTPPLPSDMIQSHFFLFAAGSPENGLDVPVTGQSISYFWLKSFPGDRWIPLPDTAILYDRNGNVKYSSGNPCVSNGVLPIQC